MLSATDTAIVAALQDGLPVETRPYLEVARRAGTTESGVMQVVKRLVAERVIKRFGLVVRHRALGYVHNAMVVWDVDDDLVDDVGERMSRFRFVTLCYRRPRRLPHWPYNLFCMIHGRDRATVMAQIDLAARLAGLESVSHEVLFSRRCFKQRGARYVMAPPANARRAVTRRLVGA